MSAPGTAAGAGPIIVEPTRPNTDIHSQKAHTMSEPVTRAEMDANLRVVKAEAETVRTGLEGKLDRVLDAIAGIGRDVAEFKTDTKTAIGNLATEVKDDYKNTRSTINNFAIGSLAIVLTVVLAISVLVWSAQGNMATQNGNVLSAFGSGKEAAEAVAEARSAAAPRPKFDDQTGRPLPQ